MGVGLRKPRPSANHIFQPPWILCASRIPSRHVQIIIHLYYTCQDFPFTIWNVQSQLINLDSTHHIRSPINCLLIFSIFPWGTANNHMYFYKSNTLNFVAILISSALKKNATFCLTKGLFFMYFVGLMPFLGSMGPTV